MSRPLRRVALGVVLALTAMPAAAHASAVDLGTASPFVVLGGSTVTNTGPSVLNGELGVWPGAALVGFGPPAVVTGAVHASDAVALQAQTDVTTAYNVAAAQPAADLSGSDLGGLTLPAGAYRFSSSAQLTGQLTLDAQGDPDAQFVFAIASTLTTASASSVRLINGASPCRVFWQVGSSATLGTATAFQGNVLALSSISLNTGTTATGRMLARNGAVTLDTNVITLPSCAAGSTTTGGSTTSSPGLPAPGSGSTVPGGTTPGAASTPATPALAVPVPPERTRGGTSTFIGFPRGNCTAGFRGAVRGAGIRRVVFSMDGRRIARVSSAPFRVYVHAASGNHRIAARITFRDGRPARTLTLRYRACAAALLRPRSGPSVYTG